VVSAISSPNRAATSLSSSTLAVPGAAVFSGGACLALEQFIFIYVAQDKEKLRLFIKPGADTIQCRRNVLAKPLGASAKSRAVTHPSALNGKLAPETLPQCSYCKVNLPGAPPRKYPKVSIHRPLRDN
jgi:hypothetical protein